MEKGKKFSQVYLEKGSPLSDSQRMRNRLGAYCWDFSQAESKDLVRKIHIETGAKIPFSHGSFILSQFFEKCEIRDLLDSITILFKHYHFGSINVYKAPIWHNFVCRVFKEEGAGYRLDELGGVHFYQDEEFERNRVSTISGLANQPAVQMAFKKAYSFLDTTSPDTASAIRSVFESLEIMYKHLIKAEGKERLNSFGVQKHLKGIVQSLLSNKPVELKASEHILDGFCDWIDAGHMYRHGQKTETTEEPSIEFSVLYISQGAGYLRFLLTLS
jgi:hypothetical protein